MKSYDSNTCHQYKKKMQFQEEDRINFGLNKNQVLKISDLEFKVIDKTDLKSVSEVKSFIEKYEWYGKINNYWNFTFALTYQDKIVCCVMIGTPMMFSKCLGEDTKNLEQTILRGASCSIAPFNSGSYLIAKAIKWVLANSPYRLFSGFSTTHEAFEYGYIYQSLNAILVSDKAGTRLEYLKPGTQDRWLSDRHLRKISNYRTQMKMLGIDWNKNWNDRWRVLWENIPSDIADMLKAQVKADMQTLTFRKVPPKLKYLIIKGVDKRETKHLLKLFREHNPKLVNADGSLGLPYPKNGRVKNEEDIVHVI
ncbi:MAG: hypothetical protein JNM93_00150 [Bacteriovoracaceae bacterium]|nr:hypothetical protein [Bacteriovoracaceae bacterium]